MLLIPDLLDYITLVSQQKCPLSASEKRTSPRNLCRALTCAPRGAGVSSTPVSSWEECKWPLPSLPYLCQFCLTVQLVDVLRFVTELFFFEANQWREPCI